MKFIGLNVKQKLPFMFRFSNTRRKKLIRKKHHCCGNTVSMNPFSATMDYGGVLSSMVL